MNRKILIIDGEVAHYRNFLTKLGGGYTIEYASTATKAEEEFKKHGLTVGMIIVSPNLGLTIKDAVALVKLFRTKGFSDLIIFITTSEEAKELVQQVKGVICCALQTDALAIIQEKIPAPDILED